ncbi:unnamed protein product [Peniophora sp. CBMAI 1063]|nr:unnamed protein product [Peniophora sp. CBMAI 1063]
MPLPSLNSTEKLEFLGALFEGTTSSIAPLLLLESFLLGMLCTFVPLGTYWFWIKSHSVPRAPIISVPWIVLLIMITHWTLSLKQIMSIGSGRLIGISLSTLDFASAGVDIETYVNDGMVWKWLLTLVSETVLFGCSSSLFACTAFVTLWQSSSLRRAGCALVIPIMAAVMYTVSLIHWAITLRSYISLADPSVLELSWFAPSVDVMWELAIVALLSINAVISDSIVLWRMCIVWEKNRLILTFAVILLVTTLALNITNIAGEGMYSLNTLGGTHGPARNGKDTEFHAMTYAGNNIGLSAAFTSLMSNACATILVGIKALMHRKLFPKNFRSENGRTQVERVLELLVESGVVYTAIWLLYCISFLRPITSQNVDGVDSDDSSYLTTSAYLDAAMAQIAAIYPLIVILLVKLGKIHHLRGPVVLSGPLRGNEMPMVEARPVHAVETAITVTFEIDVERGLSGSALAPVENDDRASAGESEETK